jgi:hypothetical protein
VVIAAGQARVRLPVTSAGRVACFDLAMVPDGVIPNAGIIRGLDVRCVGIPTPTGPEGWAIVSWLREEET